MSVRPNMKSIIKDFRFWVLLFFIIRMYGITNPPLEAAHNWRQSFTCMVARNFYEVDPNIFYPRIDIDGNRSGIVGCEFPLLNYMIFLVSKIFGYAHWYGRLINLIVSSLGIFCFYLILRKYFGGKTAFYSGLILLCSLWFSYSRKIMPDTFSLSLIMIGVYYATIYISENKIFPLVLFVVSSMLGGLAKLPALIILSFLIIPFILKSITPKALVILGFAMVLIVSVVVAWYYYWVPFLVNNYGFQHFFEKDIVTGISEISVHWGEALEKFYFGSFLSFIAFAIFLFGLFCSIRSKSKTLLGVFTLALLIFLFFAVKTGAVFPTHSYYILPFVPFMALIAGYGLSEIRKNNIRIIFVVAIMIESIANQQHDFRIKDSELYLLNLENIADKVSEKNDLVAFSGVYGYQQMYFAHRRGWSLDYSEWNDPIYLESIKQQGCKLLLINKKDSFAKLNLKIIVENENYTVYKL